MTLLSLWTAFDASARSLGDLILEFVASRPGVIGASSLTLSDECFLEGVLSRGWQAWSTFWRGCVIESCMGTTDGQGNAIAGLGPATAENLVSGAAIYAKRHRAVDWSRPNSILRLEPTWGDVDVLVRILQTLNPANSTQLLAALSSGHTSGKALQRIRNAVAHHNPETFADVQTLGASYLTFPITHPTQALFWIDRTRNDFLVTHVLEELSIVARLAIG